MGARRISATAWGLFLCGAALLAEPVQVVAFRLGTMRSPEGSGSWRHWNAYGHQPQKKDGVWSDFASAQKPGWGPYDASEADVITAEAQVLAWSGVRAVALWAAPYREDGQGRTLALTASILMRYHLLLSVWSASPRSAAEMWKTLPSHDLFRWKGRPVVFLTELPERRAAEMDEAKKAHPEILWVGPATAAFTHLFDAAFLPPPDPSRRGRRDQPPWSFAWNLQEALRAQVEDRDRFLSNFLNHAPSGEDAGPRLIAESLSAGLDDSAVGGYGKGARRIEGGDALVRGTWDLATNHHADFVTFGPVDQWNEGSAWYPTVEDGAAHLSELRRLARPEKADTPKESAAVYQTISLAHLLKKQFPEWKGARDLRNWEEALARGEDAATCLKFWSALEASLPSHVRRSLRDEGRTP